MDLQVADEVGAKMEKRAKEFRYASDELIKQEPGSGSYVAVGSERQAVPTSRTAAVVNATQTNQLKHRAFTDDVQAAKNKAQAAFSLEGQIRHDDALCAGPPASFDAMRAGVVLAVVLGVGSAAAGEPPADPLLRIEAGVHTAVVNEAAVTRDGQLVTVSDDKTVRIWSPGRGPIRVLRVPIGAGSEGALYAVATSPTRDVAVVAGHTGFAWDGAGAVYGLDLGTGALTAYFHEDYRRAGSIMSLVYALGVIVILFAPDTSGKKLSDQ